MVAEEVKVEAAVEKGLGVAAAGKVVVTLVVVARVVAAAAGKGMVRRVGGRVQPVILLAAAGAMLHPKRSLI